MEIQSECNLCICIIITNFYAYTYTCVPSFLQLVVIPRCATCKVYIYQCIHS